MTDTYTPTRHLAELKELEVEVENLAHFISDMLWDLKMAEEEPDPAVIAFLEGFCNNTVYRAREQVYDFRGGWNDEDHA